MDGLEEMDLLNNTLIIFTSDNGALPTFNQVRTNGMRGSKVSLYEGGVRMPFIISWPGKIKCGEIEDKSVVCSVDIFPSLCEITGARMPKGFNYSGEDMSQALLGVEVQQRRKDIMWDFGRNRFFGRPPQLHHQSPHLAIRRDNYKLLINSDRTCLELYDVKKDPNETTNIAKKYPTLCEKLSDEVIDWYFTKRKLRQ